MALPIAEILALAAHCAPLVAPQTLLPIVKVESAFEPLAIGVNGVPRLTVKAASKPDAVAKASALIAAGRSVDLGLGQINSKNLNWLGLTVEAAFDPCQNLAAAAKVLQAGYDPKTPAETQGALRRALSRYNTGDAHRGIANGYVGKVVKASGELVPALSATNDLKPDAYQAESPPPDWDVFGETAAPAGFIICPEARDGDRP